MMRPVVWSRDALDDLADLLDYHAMDTPEHALRLIDQIEAAGSRLGEHPTGRPGRAHGTYEKSLPRLGYIIAYQVGEALEADAIIIVRVIHSARDWRKDQWPE